MNDQRKDTTVGRRAVKDIRLAEAILASLFAILASL